MKFSRKAQLTWNSQENPAPDSLKSMQNQSNLIRFDFNRLLLPSLRNSSAKDFSAFFLHLPKYFLLVPFIVKNHFYLFGENLSSQPASASGLSSASAAVAIPLWNAGNAGPPADIIPPPPLAPPPPLPNQCSLCTHIRQHTLHTVFATVCTVCTVQKHAGKLFQVGFWLNDNISHWRGYIPASQALQQQHIIRLKIKWWGRPFVTHCANGS